MKKTVLILAAIIITLEVIGQETDSTLLEMKDELEMKKSDTTSIKFKRKTVKIYEDGEETKITVKKHEEEDWDWFWENDKDFRGSWAGFSVGLSNMVDKNFSLSRDITENYLDLNTGKSWNMNINFAQYSINLAKNKFGFVTGLGLEFNYYRFDNDNSIRENSDVIIEEYILDPTWSIEKSKLSTTFATVPLLLEFHTSASRNKGLVISAGAVGAVKLGSNTKVVYKVNGDKNKDKQKDDYNISPFRYGVTARMGVGNWLIYGTYYFTPFFEKNKGPELYPLSVGLSVSFN